MRMWRLRSTPSTWWPALRSRPTTSEREGWPEQLSGHGQWDGVGRLWGVILPALRSGPTTHELSLHVSGP